MTAGGETREREASRMLTEIVGESGPPPIAYPRLTAWLADRPAIERRRGEILFADGETYRGAVFLVSGTVALRKTSARGRALAGASTRRRTAVSTPGLWWSSAMASGAASSAETAG